MTNKPSRGALDFAKRHGLPEPKTKDEAVEMMRGILEPRSGASWRDSWRRHCGRREELWTDADEALNWADYASRNDGLTPDIVARIRSALNATPQATLADRDAEVIIQAVNKCKLRVMDGPDIYSDALIEYANQLKRGEP